jgi:hypothetical protein
MMPKALYIGIVCTLMTASGLVRAQDIGADEIHTALPAIEAMSEMLQVLQNAKTRLEGAASVVGGIPQMSQLTAGKDFLFRGTTDESGYSVQVTGPFVYSIGGETCTIARHVYAPKWYQAIEQSVSGGHPTNRIYVTCDTPDTPALNSRDYWIDFDPSDLKAENIMIGGPGGYRIDKDGRHG